MPSLREERLQERVAEVRPQLATTREIAEKAEAENRAMTPEEQTTLRRDRGSEMERRQPAARIPSGISPACRERSSEHPLAAQPLPVVDASNSVAPKGIQCNIRHCR
jgi:hypothetical protein